MKRNVWQILFHERKGRRKKKIIHSIFTKLNNLSRTASSSSSLLLSLPSFSPPSHVDGFVVL
jgi:hypothetical protein